MRTSIVKALSIATLGLFATGAFAADQVGASGNKITQTNSGARAEQKIRVGVMDGPLFGSARVNANGNTIVQSNSAARAKQTLEIGVYK